MHSSWIKKKVKISTKLPQDTSAHFTTCIEPENYKRKKNQRKNYPFLQNNQL